MSDMRRSSAHGSDPRDWPWSCQGGGVCSFGFTMEVVVVGGGSVSSEPRVQRQTCPWAMWMLHLLGHGYPHARSHPSPGLEGSLPLIGGWRGVSTWESKICRDLTPRGMFFVISRVWRLVSFLLLSLLSSSFPLPSPSFSLLSLSSVIGIV